VTVRHVSEHVAYHLVCLIVSNFLQYAYAKYYENWLAVDKVIAIM